MLSNITIKWDPNPTEERIDHYDIYRDGKFLASVTSTEYIDERVSYVSSYEVKAISIPPSNVSGIVIKVDIIDDGSESNDWKCAWRDACNNTAIQGEVNQLSLKWSQSVGFPPTPATSGYPEYRNRIVAIDGKIIATKHNCVGVPAAVAIKEDDGSILWKSFLMSDGTILRNAGIYSSIAGKLLCGLPHELGKIVDLGNGDQVNIPWGKCASTSGYSVSDETGLYGYGIGGINSSLNPQVQVLNPDGSTRWTQYEPWRGKFLQFRYYAGGPFPANAVMGQPAKFESTLYLPMGQLNALNTDNGSFRWSIGTYTGGVMTVGSFMYYGVASVVDGVLYCPSRTLTSIGYAKPHLDSINLSTGKIINSIEAPEWPNYKLNMYMPNIGGLLTDTLNYVINDGIAYMRGPSELRATRISDGSILWSNIFSDPNLINGANNLPLTGPIIYINDRLFITHQNSIIEFNATTGEQIWKWDNSKFGIMNWIIMAYNKLFAIDISGNVFCFS